ncbi:MAG: hypothetical protein J6T52_07335 [Bacteroidaceae bacterium]|nr:hypothetical protein [Bacteroidaceae bacterium]
MKIKSLLSFFVPAALMSLAVASCSDYDNGYNESAIKFQEEFRKAFGDIDPEQDWNFAERGTVTVSTMKESEVKIYALRGNEYAIVGDYEGVKGTRTLGFDMPEGTTSIVVSDGVTAEKTEPGGSVTFGETRTINWDPNDANGDGVKVTKINGSVTIKGKTYLQYKEITKAGVDAMQEVIPEIGRRGDRTNLWRVTHDFSYVSNGEFVIYPYFWDTSSDNTIGVYYTDASGQYHEVDIYTNKGEGIEASGIVTQEANLKDARLVGESQYIGNISKRNYTNGNLQAQYFQDYAALIYIPTYGIQLYNLGLPNDISSYTKLVVNAELKNGTPNYRVIIYPRNSDGSLNNDGAKTFVITSSNTDYEIDLTSNEFNGFPLNNCEIRLSGGNAANPSAVTIQGMDGCRGDIQFKKLALVKPSNNWSQFNGQDCNDIIKDGRGRGQGIVVSIPQGTKFGMYLKKTDGVVGDCTFYSESSKNTDVTKHGRGIIDDGVHTVNWDDPNSKPSYASSFFVGDQMFLGFEDWPNNTAVWGGGDFDLNDIVLAFDGSTPTIINEDPTVGTWLLVCEDLGGSFDTDYNDVIFSVEHVSGQRTAKVTAMAAGGTLASYIVFRDPTNTYANDQILGEIHQLFDVSPQESGAYTPINVSSRYEKIGNTVTIKVGENWTMAWYSTDTWQSEGTEYNAGVNMGGFRIYTLPSGTPAPYSVISTASLGSNYSVIAAPGKGSAPYILCLPYKYDKVDNGKLSTYVWAWPQELSTICSSIYENSGYSGVNGGAYNKFGGWVSNHQTNKDWYTIRTNDLTVEELKVSTQGTNSNVPQQLNLGNKGEITIQWGTTVNLFDNLVNAPDGGTYTFTYDGGSGSGTIINPSSWTPYNAVVRTITVTRKADDQYLEASTSFTFTVTKRPANLSSNNGSESVGASFNLNDYISTSSNAPLNYGTTYHFVANDPDFPSAYASEADYDNFFDKENGAMSKTEYAGTYTFTITQPENDKYFAATTTLTITVTKGGNSSSGYLSETRTGQYNIAVTSNGDGTFNLAYNNNTIKSNATMLKLTWEENYTIEYDYEVGTGRPIPKEVVKEIRLSNNQKGDDLKGRNGSTTITLSDWDPGWGNNFNLILSATDNNEWKLKVE